jgi:hypothetical protein
MENPWKCVGDELMGSWCIIPMDGPPTPSDGATQIADFLDEEVARYICSIHNLALLEKKINVPII